MSVKSNAEKSIEYAIINASDLEKVILKVIVRYLTKDNTLFRLTFHIQFVFRINVAIKLYLC